MQHTIQTSKDIDNTRTRPWHDHDTTMTRQAVCRFAAEVTMKADASRRALREASGRPHANTGSAHVLDAPRTNNTESNVNAAASTKSTYNTQRVHVTDSRHSTGL